MLVKVVTSVVANQTSPTGSRGPQFPEPVGLLTQGIGYWPLSIPVVSGAKWILAMSGNKRKSKRIERDDNTTLVSLTGNPIIKCVVKDISATGACILVAVPEVVPDYFKLRIEGKRVLLPKCRVRWRSGNEVGVQFFR